MICLGEKSALEAAYQDMLDKRKSTSSVVGKISDIDDKIAELTIELAKLKTPRTDFDFFELKGKKLSEEMEKMENFAQNHPSIYKKHFQELGLKLVIKDKHLAAIGGHTINLMLF